MVDFSQKLAIQFFPLQTVSSGWECIWYLGLKIWTLFPDEFKELKALEFFKGLKFLYNFLKKYSKLCRNCIHRVGYVDGSIKVVHFLSKLLRYVWTLAMFYSE